MSDDKMRVEFEAWAKAEGFDLSRLKLDNFDSSDYASSHTSAAEDGFEAGYAAGRMAKQREAEEWSKAVNKRWIETANEREGQL